MILITNTPERPPDRGPPVDHSRRVIRLFCILLLFVSALESRGAGSNAPFDLRGYYMTFMRMPAMALPQWKEMVDCLEEDGGNTLLLWTAGAFRSRKFPVTWKYNEEHQNIRHDFVRELIDYAHQKKIKVLLCFTPFAYDGVNQYPLEHPELKATQRNGAPAQFWGMHSWGYNLCPARPESLRFMHEYVREMCFDFYPAADGVLIESSDYAICYCPECGQKFFEREFAFVKSISDEIRERQPGAMVVVYPHYFSGRRVPGFEVQAAKEPFDSRWTLFFTPHSAQIDPRLIESNAPAIYWTDGLTLGTPAKIRDAARTAKKFQMRGYLPSLEPFSCRPGPPGQAGERVKPFHFDWLKEGEMPLKELLIRVNRIAYREFCLDPDLGLEEFTQLLGKEIFGAARARSGGDLLFLQETYFFEADWFIPSPYLAPGRLKERAAKEQWPPERLKRYQSRLGRVRAIGAQYANSDNEAEREMGRIARLIADRWKEIGE